MRPRHKTAENRAQGGDHEVALDASMRPRHKTAENRHVERPPDVHAAFASMRPRHKTAENVACTVRITSVASLQ